MQMGRVVLVTPRGYCTCESVSMWGIMARRSMARDALRPCCTLRWSACRAGQDLKPSICWLLAWLLVSALPT